MTLFIQHLCRLFLLLILWLCLTSCAQVHTPYTLGQNGQLVYHPDTLGNTLPDFSYAGYKANNEPIPNVEVVKTIYPVAGDNTNHINTAIQRLTLGEKTSEGFYGTLLLKAGDYKVEGTIKLLSGVVIRGEGRDGLNRTRIIATGKSQRSLIQAQGQLKLRRNNKLTQPIVNDYVPVGSNKLTVADSSVFAVGDEILIINTMNDTWVDELGMNRIPQRRDGRKIKQWEASKYQLKYERKITAIEENSLTIDVPLVQMINKTHGGGIVIPISPTGRINHVAVENMRLTSEYQLGQENSDEDHSWIAIELDDVENAWVSNVTAEHFAKSLALVRYGSRLITVKDALNLSPVSKITGRRRYSFATGGAQTLFLRCSAQYGRHDYLTFSKVPGPNAFVFGRAINTYSDIGPHMRWATGTLFDNIEGGDFNVEDRSNLGTGHGWSGAQQVFWNTKSVGETAMQSPPGALNWSIGHIGKRSQGRWNRPQGIWLSHGENVKPQSLFVQQLLDRIGVEKTQAILATSHFSPFHKENQ